VEDTRAGQGRAVSILVALVAAGAVAAGLRAIAHRTEAVRADNAAGDAACLSCHQGKASFEQTAHGLTSTLPTRQSIAGSFSRGENVLRTSNPRLHFRMDSTATGFYQTAVMGRAPDTSSHSERIAFVTGSRKGQSYLYWGGDQLYQLPVSYWTGVGWVNSPGYPDGTPNFGRPIPPRCLECHASWFEHVPDPAVINRYRLTGMILGISCETCHGAGREHVRRERSLLRSLVPRAIVNPARLARARQVDQCALCHSGTAAPRTAAFSHVPGQPLEKRSDWLAGPDTGEIDVHGNQVGLLQRSKCFRSSQMTCATCHDVHREQRDVGALSGRCLTCHTMQSCGLFPTHGQELAGRCVDCHMPALTSTVLIANYLGHPVRVQVRTHWIKVYPPPRIPCGKRPPPDGAPRCPA
jgi:cytochrome c554/c'-like protein